MSAYVIKDDKRAVDTPDGVVTDARLDGGHPGVDKLGRHGGGSDGDGEKEVEEWEQEREEDEELCPSRRRA